LKALKFSKSVLRDKTMLAVRQLARTVVLALEKSG